MPVIACQNLAKSYRLGNPRTSLREALPELAGRLLGRRPAEQGTFWALRDVSFQVEAGEVLGIIGHNGAGKSTLFKLLSRITRPTSGQLQTSGRMAALIELGAGFHPDLTGRENVFLNGAILGLRREEIRRRFDAIVDFAGLERFIDTPIKRYSSGMYVRLAFAIAAHVQADLLLVDEVLSVGDTAFQAKCLEKMRELHRGGTTIVLISHDTWTVQRFCKRALLLSGGRLIADGDPEAVIERYQEQVRGEQQAEAAITDDTTEGEAQIVRVELRDAGGAAAREFAFSSRVLVRVHYRSPRAIVAPVLVLRIRRADGLVCCALNNLDEPRVTLGGEGYFDALIGPLPLVPDFYRVEALILDRDQPLAHAFGASELLRIRGALVNARDAGVFAPDIAWLGVGDQELEFKDRGIG